MNYITTLQRNNKKQIELAKDYAAKFQNDFAVEESNNFVKVFATRYIGCSFLNKVKKLRNMGV